MQVKFCSERINRLKDRARAALYILQLSLSCARPSCINQATGRNFARARGPRPPVQPIYSLSAQVTYSKLDIPSSRWSVTKSHPESPPPPTPSLLNNTCTSGIVYAGLSLTRRPLSRGFIYYIYYPPFNYSAHTTSLYSI